MTDFDVDFGAGPDLELSPQIAAYLAQANRSMPAQPPAPVLPCPNASLPHAGWDALADTFKDGDILYGLDEGRGEAKRAVLARRDHVVKQTRIFSIPVRTKRFERIIIQNDITNSVFNPGEPGLRSDEQIKQNPKIASDPARALAFRDFLRDHPKYSLADHQPDNDFRTMKSSFQQAWLKTSKAGLAFHATERPGARIHFVLDGLDYKRALEQKAEPADVARRTMKSPGDITSGEVRWLFRNRADPRVASSVVYWHQGRQVRPPWEWPENREHFANFLQTKSANLDDEAASSELRAVLDQVKSSVTIQRAFRQHQGTYYVREGDSLQTIADRHAVSVDDLRAWNGLPSDQIAPGQILRTRA